MDLRRVGVWFFAGLGECESEYERERDYESEVVRTVLEVVSRVRVLRDTPGECSDSVSYCCCCCRCCWWPGWFEKHEKDGK